MLYKYKVNITEQFNLVVELRLIFSSQLFLFVFFTPSVPGERAAEDVPALGIHGHDGSG